MAQRGRGSVHRAERALGDGQLDLVLVGIDDVGLAAERAVKPHEGLGRGSSVGDLVVAGAGGGDQGPGDGGGLRGRRGRVRLQGGDEGQRDRRGAVLHGVEHVVDEWRRAGGEGGLATPRQSDLGAGDVVAGPGPHPGTVLGGDRLAGGYVVVGLLQHGDVQHGRLRRPVELEVQRLACGGLGGAVQVVGQRRHGLLHGSRVDRVTLEVLLEQGQRLRRPTVGVAGVDEPVHERTPRKFEDGKIPSAQTVPGRPPGETGPAVRPPTNDERRPDGPGGVRCAVSAVLCWAGLSGRGRVRGRGHRRRRCRPPPPASRRSASRSSAACRRWTRR